MTKTETNQTIFTAKDILCESGLFLLGNADLLGSWQIIVSAMRYNQAKKTGDKIQIAAAYQQLHYEMKLFKKNYLSQRYKGHW